MKSCAVVLLWTSLQLSSAYHIAFFVPFRVGANIGKIQNGNQYAHALTIAIDDVNNDPNILRGHNLTYHWTDSTDRLEVLRAMYEKYVSPNSVDVFIGPAYDCSAPARIAQAFKKPLITYFCQENSPFDKQTYPLLVQTYQNANNQAALALFATLKTLKWKRIGIIYENYTYWRDLKATIDKEAGGDELRIVSEEMVPNYQLFNPYGANNEDLESRNKSIKRVKEALTKMAKTKMVKIFVVLTSYYVLLDVIAEARLLRIAGANKPYNVFIGFQLDVRRRRKDFISKSSMLFFNPYVLGPQERIDRQQITRNGARSLLLISPAKPINTERYIAFKKELINRTESKEPFMDSAVFDEDLRPTSPVETAMALYDAVYQYAQTLQRLHNKSISVTAQAVVDEFRNQSYVSIGGGRSEFNPSTGSLEIHLSLLHLDEKTVERNFKAKAKEIGTFDKSTLQLSIGGDGKIIWPWGTEHPDDELNCQNDGYKCPSANEDEATHRTVAIILSVVLTIILFLLILFIVRQWLRERELKRAIWQIDTSDIVIDRKVSTESAFSDDSGVSLQAVGFDITSRYKQFSYRRCHTNNTLDILREDSTEGCPLNSLVTARNTTGHFKGDRVFIKILPKNVEVTVQLQKDLRILRHIQHENLNKFIGLGVETSCLWVVMQLGSKGTLEEVLANQDVSLNYTFVLSLVYDIAKGMTFLHNSDIKSHGNLKSSNCVIDNRWVLKITDYGIPEIRLRQLRYTNVDGEQKKFKDLFWKAPELLRQTDAALRGTQKGDVYSFAIILEEFHTLRSPYSDSSTPAREIIDRILDAEVPPYRPVVVRPIDNAEELLGLMKNCWRETPDKRPSFQDIKYDVESEMIRSGLKTDICDNMILLLENYSSNLENVVLERTRQLREEKHKTEALLDRMLPRSVAEQLKKGENVQAESFQSVTIYFSDIVQFTALCAESTPMEVVDLLNDLYLLFDDIIKDYKVYKVETIGDAYMVVSGLPTKNGKLHASEISCMALEILENVKSFKVKHKPEHELQVRIGIHTGPVVAGVVGMTMPRYCLFGDTVNTASRMESNGEALCIHVSESTRDVLDELGGFDLKQREGQVYVKGKGNCTTYWLEGASTDVPRCPRKLSKKALKPLFLNASVRKLSAPFRTRKKTELSIPRFSVA